MALNYRATATITITLASLASSTSFVAGEESTAYDNSTNKDPGGFLAGTITTGTTPTAGAINVYVAAPLDDTPNWPDVLDGTDSVETFTASNVQNGIVRLVASITTDSTSNRAYYFSGVDVSLAFGGIMPAKWVVFVSHSTVAALNATGGNHSIKFTPYYFT